MLDAKAKMCVISDMNKPTAGEHVRCPKCFSIDVRYSKRGLWDAILDRFFHMEVFRCRNCRKRFHQFVPEEEHDA
jgi:DNA-directed RNA polymerase subunit RPC12/RpoP